MPYDNLIKRLWECASGECFNCSQYTETTNASVCSKELMKQVADAIEELSKPRWIPVTERLPEEEKKRYWVCTDTEYQCECRWTNNRFGMGEFDEWGWSIFDIPQYSHVVAWMPLPEPPEEVTQDD